MRLAAFPDFPHQEFPLCCSPPMHHRFLLVGALALAGVTHVRAQTAPAATPSLDVHATAVPPKIDGVLSPGEWNGAAHSDALRMVEPTEGGVPTERTEFWVTYDADNFYV